MSRTMFHPRYLLTCMRHYNPLKLLVVIGLMIATTVDPGTVSPTTSINDSRRLFGTPPLLAEDISLQGIVVAGQSRYAILRVSGQAHKPLEVGDNINPLWRVAEIGTDSVKLTYQGDAVNYSLIPTKKTR